MLSRVANSIYWMCRYIERAENVARFIGVNLNLLLDMNSGTEQHWSPIVMTTGDQELYEKKGQAYDEASVLWFLTFDREYPNSILSCVAAARENARSIREIISPELWEHLNQFYLDLMREDSIRFALQDPQKFYHVILMRSNLFIGLMNNTMSHGEAWNFARMGRMIERADKTSRILDVKYFMLLPEVELVNAPIDYVQWISVLRSASAFEMYRQTKQTITPKGIADFLIFDEHFPRSIHHCVTQAQKCLYNILESPKGPVHPVGKLLGRLRADLDYMDIDEVLELGLHEFLDGLQVKLNNIDLNIGTSFFNIQHHAFSESRQQ
ncbi:alpha-E domain-containing protein [Desulfogranum japonicum]|uniref:alpha-E domain-containing protein n=1 Tax=Desulfogranum japonicum TaxID=231447 RepID=UPI00048CDB3A|nr:alpha-E domain-containing protein [Desulfogranum japonicum]